MDLSSARVGGARITHEERQYRLDNGLYKRYGGLGHIAAHYTPALRAASAPSRDGAQSNRGAPRSGGRGGRGSFGAPYGGAPYNGGGRGYSAPAPYSQHPQQ